MSRYFMIQSWVGSHENEPDYNGQQGGSRAVRSSEVVPLYDQFGNANVSAFSDEAIAARSEPSKRSTSISIKDRILPQSKRLITLRSQMIELENEYRTTDMTIEEYTMLRDVIVCKIDRAQVLYLKASSVKPIRNDEETDEFNGENDYESCATDYSYATPQGTDKDSFVDQLSHTNIFKSPLEKACSLYRKTLQFKHKISKYLQTLKDL